MKDDCVHYKDEKCLILKKLYCKTEKCSFYIKDENKCRIKKKCNIEKRECKNNDKKRKNDRKEQSRFYYHKYKINKDNKIKYINYGELIFSEEEIEALKSKKLKIY